MLDFIKQVQAALPEAKFVDPVFADAGWPLDNEDVCLCLTGSAQVFRNVLVVLDAGQDWRSVLVDKALSVAHGGNLWAAGTDIQVVDLVRAVQEHSEWRMIVAEEQEASALVCAIGNGTGERFPAVSVVVPTVQSAYLPRFFATHRSLQRGRGEYVVVSNGTEPVDLKQMIALRPDVFVHFQEPLGFPRAMNVGASLTRQASEVLVLANDDTEMTLNGWDSRLWEIADGERDLGAVAPVLSSIGNRWQLHGAIPVPDLYEAPVLFYAWVAFPRTVWQDVGGLNEEFGMGNCEDIDHSLRIRLSGRRLLVDPVTAVYHRVHGTFDLMTPAQFNSVLAQAASTLLATWGDRLAELAPDVDRWAQKMAQSSGLSIDTAE